MEAVWEVSGSTLIRYTGDDREIVIPESISEIARNAFHGNKKITSVIIPNRIEKIGSGAFAHCTALQTVKIADVHVIDSLPIFPIDLLYLHVFLHKCRLASARTFKIIFTFCVLPCGKGIQD